MAYVPPNKRTPKAFVNTSQKRCVAPPKKEFVNITSNESFPILGNISSTAKVETSSKYLSSMITKISIDPEAKHKMVDDGWLHINKTKGSSIINFTFGKKSKQRKHFETYIDDLQFTRRMAAYDKLHNRILEYEENDLLVNGEKYINGWEYDDYIKELEMQQKFEEMENMSSDDESSDEDDIYELN